MTVSVVQANSESNGLRSAIAAGITSNFVGEICSKLIVYCAEFFLIARLPVAAYGTWTGVQTITRAFPYLHAGSLSAYSKHVPLLDGAGRSDDSSQLDICIGSFLRCVGLGAVALSILAMWSGGGLLLPELGFFEWLCIGGVAAATQSFAYHQARLRAEMSFVRLNVGVLVHAVLFATVTAILLPRMQATGALIGLLTAYTGAAAWYGAGIPRRFRLEYSELKRILVLGFAPFLLVVTHFLLHTGERFVLLASGNRELMAMYLSLIHI